MHMCSLKALMPPYAQAIFYAGRKQSKLLLTRIILKNEDNK